MARDPAKPSVSILFGGNEAPEEIINAVTSLEVDLTFGMADQIRLKIVNPIRDEFGSGYVDGRFAFTDTKAFMPGNQIDVLLGWGDDIQHVASGIIQKWLPRFPRDGVPQLEIVALDAASRLMDGASAKEARSYPDFDLDLVILEILNRHNIKRGDVRALPGTARPNLFKKAGMSDFQFVKGLSNLTGHEFNVYYDFQKGEWYANWRPFTETDQSVEFTFTYLHEQATLLDFEPEWGLRDSPSEVRVVYFDPNQGTFDDVKVGKDQPGEDMKFTKKELKDFFDGPSIIKQAVNSMSELRISCGEVSVTVIPERPFTDAESAQRYAEAWIDRHKNAFISGRGYCIGIETLRPGDVHNITGIGTALSGRWEFRSVRHVYDSRRGYECEFMAHKEIDL